MFKLSCKALGIDDCDYQAEGDTKVSAIDRMRAHTGEEHTGVLQQWNDTMSAAIQTEKMEDALEPA